MGDIAKIISAEIYKQSKTRSLITVPVMIIVITVLIFLAVSAASDNLSFGPASGFYITAASLGWIVKGVSLAAVIITCFQISNEFSMGTVKAAWVQPLSRRMWYSGKLLHSCIISWGILIISAALLILLASLKYDFESLVENNYLIHSESDLWLKSGLILLLSLWVTGVIIAATSAVSLIFNAAGSSISVVIAASLLMVILEIFGAARPFLLTSYISLPVEQFVLMAKGLPLQMSWKEITYHTLGFPAGYLALSLTAGYAMVNRKEIKS
ncbi:MAG: hypothetical protein R6U43_09405 [Candidatus Krumholzibacteriales bacterium]